MITALCDITLSCFIVIFFPSSLSLFCNENNGQRKDDIASSLDKSSSRSASEANEIISSHINSSNVLKLFLGRAVNAEFINSNECYNFFACFFFFCFIFMTSIIS